MESGEGLALAPGQMATVCWVPRQSSAAFLPRPCPTRASAPLPHPGQRSSPGPPVGCPLLSCVGLVSPSRGQMQGQGHGKLQIQGYFYYWSEGAHSQTVLQRGTLNNSATVCVGPPAHPPVGTLRHFICWCFHFCIFIKTEPVLE